MTRTGKEALGERLGALAYWLAFSAVVTALWIVLPEQAAAARCASMTTQLTDQRDLGFARHHLVVAACYASRGALP
jgi:hypothetical protein